METENRYVLKITRLEGDKEAGVVAQMMIDERQIKAVCAAGLGLAQPRSRKEKAAPAAKIGKA